MPDPNSESRGDGDFYIPRDERFGHLKQNDFTIDLLKGFLRSLVPVICAIFDPSNKTPTEFGSFDDILRLFQKGLPVPNVPLVDQVMENVPFKMLRDMVSTKNKLERIFKFSKPHVIQGSLSSQCSFFYAAVESLTRRKVVSSLFCLPNNMILVSLVVDVNAWCTDEEFAREMLAGVNPAIISRLQAI